MAEEMDYDGSPAHRKEHFESTSESLGPDDAAKEQEESNVDRHEFVARNGPNQKLTPSEKQVRKALKARLKLESRKRKYQIRHEHAMKRKDLAAADQAFRDLQGVLAQLERQEKCSNLHWSMRNNDDPPLVQESRRIIEYVYHEVQKKLKTTRLDESNGSGSKKPKTTKTKELQNEQARLLLRNMTKGTQNLSMFENEAALLGYVRQKFIERALLVASSLSKLSVANEREPQSAPSPAEARTKIWDRLQSIQKVVSIGCGPGCDGVGIAAWLAAAQQSRHQSLGNGEEKRFYHGLKQLVLLDWAMPKWELIIEPLKDIVVPNLVNEVHVGVCDVLSSEENALQNKNAVQSCTDADLIISSYLLSETRSRWFDFYDKIMDVCVDSSAKQQIGTNTDKMQSNSTSAKGGTLFLFSDPTAWQLHEWLNRNKERLESWCWLDSSMNDADLQILEGRVGPAVLLAMAKPCTTVSKKSG
ncbi:hypothetical protein ACA910_012803 [Epithemia clementina (nom. ined.)]